VGVLVNLIVYIETIPIKTSLHTILLYLTLFAGFRLPPKPNELPIQFDVLLDEEKVGSLSAFEKTDGTSVTYSLESDVKAGWLISIHIREEMLEVFSGSQLRKSSITRTIDGHVRENNTAHWDGNRYILQNKKKEVKYLDQPITASALSLYFSEPVQVPLIYSQHHQLILPITAIGSHGYKVVQPNGYMTIYQYAGGQIISVESESSWGRIKFVRKM
jgi:hypothetical protein